MNWRKGNIQHSTFNIEHRGVERYAFSLLGERENALCAKPRLKKLRGIPLITHH
jgi:hypothetical protein